MANETTYVLTIVTIFILIGVFLPYANQEFSSSSVEYSADSEGLYNDLAGTDFSNPIDYWTVAGSISSMFFWTFGGLPWFIDVLFLPIRILLLYLIARLVRGGG